MNAIHGLAVHIHGGELTVACPQRIDRVPVATCVSCELCDGLDLDPASGRAAVRCRAASPERGACDTPVAGVMTEHVVTVPPDAAIENVRWLLLDRGLGAVPVLEHGKTIGIVSKSDLLRDGYETTMELETSPDAPAEEGSSERATSGLCARDVMTPVVFAVAPEASIADTAVKMIERRVHHLPVVDPGGALRGIVSSLDLVRWLASSSRTRD